MEITPVTLDFNRIVKEINISTGKLLELFRTNLFYYELITSKGLEFDRLREYTMHDDASMIDWNATARSQEPYVKMFKEERMLDVVVLLDVSNTMLLGTQRYTKNQFASVVGGVILNVAIQAGDFIGSIMFSNDIKASVEPNPNPDTLYAITKLYSDPFNYGGIRNLDTAMNISLETFSRDSVIFLISDFIGMNKTLRKHIADASSRFYKVFGVMVRDPIDSFIPKGAGKMYLADPNTGKTQLVDLDKIRDGYNKQAQREEREVEDIFLGNGVDFIKMHTTDNFIDLFVKYFMIKKGG